MQLGLMLTDETLLFGEHLALQSAVDDCWWVANCGPAMAGQKLSWIVYGTLLGSSTTPPETTGHERTSWMARIPQQFRLKAESLMQLKAARQPDNLVCRQSLSLRAVPTHSCGVTRRGSTSRS